MKCMPGLDDKNLVKSKWSCDVQPCVQTVSQKRICVPRILEMFQDLNLFANNLQIQTKVEC